MSERGRRLEGPIRIGVVKKGEGSCSLRLRVDREVRAPSILGVAKLVSTVLKWSDDNLTDRTESVGYPGLEGFGKLAFQSVER